MNIMSAALDQFQFENMTWSRSLDFFKQENAHLKDRLSEIVDKTSDKHILAQAEHFQNQFIIKDEFIDELKHDINEQAKLIKDCSRKNQNGTVDFCSIQDKLREQMQYLEKDFAELRKAFYEYIIKSLVISH